MTTTPNPLLTGGCQCGAVRYVLRAAPDAAAICHCRMCQKAMGGPFMAYVTTSEVEWTEGRPSVFRSSSLAERGFCHRCGTPLFFRPLDSAEYDITLGSLDNPEALPPVRQTGAEAMLSWFTGLHALPAEATEGQPGLVSHQHPDSN